MIQNFRGQNVEGEKRQVSLCMETSSGICVL